MNILSIHRDDHSVDAALVTIDWHKESIKRAGKFATHAVRMTECKLWCRENIGEHKTHRWAYTYSMGDFYFHDAVDAIAFKLKFGP